MFNLNIPPSSLLGVEGSGGLCSKPNTPEILNSLIAMTNPLDNYNFTNNDNNSNHNNVNGSLDTTNALGAITVNTSNNHNNTAITTTNNNTNSSHNNNVQIISMDSCSSSGSPINSPVGGTSAAVTTTTATPSVQQTCSQLIKAGLKLTIQSKRKMSTCESSSGSEQPSSKYSRRNDECGGDETTDEDSEHNKSVPPSKGLTPEDEDRRRRRRERNKIAATKCRMKKRERTQNLIKESEQLDTQNVDLKNQVRSLEIERRKLLDMLQAHEPDCVHAGGLIIPTKLLQSPAFKYLSNLNLDDSICDGGGARGVCSNGSTSNSTGRGNSNGNSNNNGNCNTNDCILNTQPRTVIPPMSTIKFSRSNGFKAAAAVTAAAAAFNNSIVTMIPQLASTTTTLSPQISPHSGTANTRQTSQINNTNCNSHLLENGYCKPSPTDQELDYLNSPTHDSNSLCLTTTTSGHLNACNNTSNTAQQTLHTNLNSTGTTAAVSGLTVAHSLADYIPHCDSPSLGPLTLTHTHTPTACSTPNSLMGNSCGGDNSVLLASVASPLSVVSTPTNEFVKNELVDSQSPYTTAQSAERFLFENNCDNFVDIKHAINLHHQTMQHNNHNNNNSHGGPTLLQHTNMMGSTGNLLDFTTLMNGPNGACNIGGGGAGGGVGVSGCGNNGGYGIGIGSGNGTGSSIISFHDQISIKNDYLQEADLLAQLTGEAAEFVDLDSSVAAAFMTNGGCLA